MGVNKSTGAGWKDNNCLNETGDKIYECIENYAFSANEIFVSNENHKYQPVYREGKMVKMFAASSNQSIKVESYYLSNVSGMVHVVKADSGIISKNYESSLNLYLNNSMSYFVTIIDLKVAITSSQVGIVPRLLIRLENGAASAARTYLNLNVRELYFYIQNR